MNHDDSRRIGVIPRMPPGPGAHLSFRCPKCNVPKSPLGRRMQRFQGIRQYLCHACVTENLTEHEGAID